jgi:aminopeptidase YwaD
VWTFFPELRHKGRKELKALMGTNKTEVTKHLEHLCVEIGPRPIGSKGNRAAADYIARVFEASGLGVEVQSLTCPAWEDEGTRLDLDGQPLTAAANTFSPPCDVIAPMLTVGTVAELAAAKLTGCIGIMYGDLTKGTGYGARSAIYFPERDQKIIGLLEEKQPAALITVNVKPGSLDRLMRDWQFPIPSATVPAEVGLKLLEQRRGSLHLKISSRQSLGRFCNVVARKSGTRQERVVFMAHFDTVADTPGAIDNGSGVAVLLALAEQLANRDLPFGLEWIAFNGEEIGGLGDVEYLQRREGDLGRVLVAINIDGAGQRLGANSITTMGCSEAFQDQVRQAHAQYPGVVWGDPWYESNHSAFLWRGVPCIPVGSVGVGHILHSPADTVEWTSPAKLNEVVSLITRIVEGLHDRSPDWYRVSSR